ncbi:MAG: DUF433 domain-containing protein [Saprospiraceae bacterium]|nr:DUF433 domain-containing protein [Saprospiraceae bacterium]
MTAAREAELLGRITINPKVVVGKPTIRGTRFTVEHLLKALSAGLSFEELKEEYPFLEPEDVQASLLYASNLVEEEKVYAISE